MADRPPIRVLCVDDEPGFATLTADVLDQQHDDIRAVGVTSAEAALGRLEESTFDCVVSDYDMPDVDSLELLDAVRERYPSKPFILFTGRGSEAIASEAISSGVSDYLQKSGGQELVRALGESDPNVRHAAQGTTGPRARRGPRRGACSRSTG
ncbi:hypothetical protein DJ72_12385, partial [Halorubrum distributum]